MKVLFSTTLAHTPLAFGGSQQSTDDLAHALMGLGHEVAVSSWIGSNHRTLGWGFRIRRRLRWGVGRDTWRDVPIYRLGQAVSDLPRVVRRTRPDVVIVQAGRQSRMLEVLESVGVPTVLYLRDHRLVQRDGPPPSRRTVVVANSEFIAGLYRDRGWQVDFVVPPLVDPTRFRVESDRTRVLMVNPIPAKGGLIAAEVARQCPDIPFLFQEGWHRDDSVWIATRDLQNVEWRPNVTDMREAYRHARVVLAPSGAHHPDWVEAWGRIATEAHISGIPVVAANAGGLPEAVGPGGMLVHPDAPAEAWVDALRSIWDDPARYDALARDAAEHARRAGIQPDHLAAEVVTACGDAVQRSRA